MTDTDRRTARVVPSLASKVIAYELRLYVDDRGAFVAGARKHFTG